MAVSSHFNNGKPGCLDATIKIGIPVTVFRLWVQDNKYQMLALEGKTIRPKRHLLGNNGLVQFEKSNLATSYLRSNAGACGVRGV